MNYSEQKLESLLKIEKLLCVVKLPFRPKNEFYTILVSLGAGSCMDAQQFFEIMIAPFPNRVSIFQIIRI